MELSPVHPGWYHFAHSWRYYFDGQVRAALTELKKVPMPGFFWYHAHLAWYHADLGDDDLAKAEVGRMLEIYPQFAERVREEVDIWCMREELVEFAIRGWRKAGLVIQ